jgi:RNA recognition motif-containing protein
MRIDISSLNLRNVYQPGSLTPPPGLTELAAEAAAPRKLPSPLAECNARLALENAYLRQVVSASLAVAVTPARKQANESLSTSAANSDAEVLSDSDGDRTTVIIKGLPEAYTREMLTMLLDTNGFRARYDFVYLPYRFETRLSVGYGFVNFVSVEDADRCVESLGGFEALGIKGGSCLSVSFAESMQGLEAHIERYRSSPAMHAVVPDDMKPALYQGGIRIPFPAPTKPIRAPRSLRC